MRCIREVAAVSVGSDRRLADRTEAFMVFFYFIKGVPKSLRKQKKRQNFSMSLQCKCNSWCEGRLELSL